MYCGGICSTPLEEKRVRNNLIRKELGVQLMYPTIARGCAPSMQAACSPLRHHDRDLAGMQARLLA